MFELYKKVNKSIEFPKGAKKITEGENPFKDGTCLLCISAQDRLNESIFGLTKLGARMARIRVNGDKGARIPLDEVPISFLSIKTDDQIDKEEDCVNNFVETYIKPILLDENGLAKSKDKAAKVMRNVNMMSNCDGTKRALNIIQGIEQLLTEMSYTEGEIDEILSQVSLLSFQTERDLSNCKASVIDFHNVNDTEVEINQNNIDNEMLARNNDSKGGESVEKRANRIEVLINSTDSHSVKDYIKNGEAMPVIVHSMISSILENSIENANDENSNNPLSIEELFGKAKTILDRINNGEKKENLIEELDSSLNYGGRITKLSDRELELIESQERIIKEYDKSRSEFGYSKQREERLQKEKDNMLQISNDACTEGTYFRILEAYGWQLNDEQREKIETSETDKKTIEEQNTQIEKLQTMLGRTLQFADDVRNSVLGKIFFRKSIKKLPKGKENER